MRKYIIIFLVALVLMVVFVNVSTEVVYARAGGGSSSGGGGSGSSSGGTTSHTSVRHYGNGYVRENPIVSILKYIVFIIVACFSGILFKAKIIRAKIHSKQLMRLLDNKDETWKYKNVQKQVEKAYFVIQNAWAEQDMDKALEYMDETLYASFKTKLEWMKIRKQKNVMKKISLVEAMPVAINDNEDDSKDYIWYYIRGSMIDYTINIETNEITEGKNMKSRFTEYWKFIRKDNNWVLAEILQSDESNKIVFS